MRRRLHRITGGLIAAGLLAAASAAPAAAATLQPSTALRAARSAASRTAHDTRASSSRVLGCERQSKLSFFCRGELRYSQGASKCTVDIRVWYPSATNRRLRTATSNTRCF